MDAGIVQHFATWESYAPFPASLTLTLAGYNPRLLPSCLPWIDAFCRVGWEMYNRLLEPAAVGMLTALTKKAKEATCKIVLSCH